MRQIRGKLEKRGARGVVCVSGVGIPSRRMGGRRRMPGLSGFAGMGSSEDGREAGPVAAPVGSWDVLGVFAARRPA